jgi:hypothetical protein
MLWNWIAGKGLLLQILKHSADEGTLDNCQANKCTGFSSTYSLSDCTPDFDYHR